MSLGGKITIGLACLWTAGSLLILAAAKDWISPGDAGFAVLYGLHLVLAFPLGFIGTGLASMDHAMSSREIALYLLLMLPNLFLQGHALAGIWQLFRRLTGPLRRDFT